jgi:uncharacterized glyoxalase superfamily protein PhnB
MKSMFPGAVPEIPVRSLNEAIAYYQNKLGFTLDWSGEDIGLASISKGNCRMFLANHEYRKGFGNVGTVVTWLNLDGQEEVDALYCLWNASQAKLISTPESKPWGLYEFTAADLDGNLFRVFYDFATPEREGNALHRDAAAEKIISLAPQFLVDDLSAALAYYQNCLGFETDFVYESFYASVSRDGFAIHLKCAPKTATDRTQRRQHEHLDAYIRVQGIEALFNEFMTKGAFIIRSLEEKPWGCQDFYVEDSDGYLLCFSEETSQREHGE